jgi:hypothetical protein
MSEPALKLVAPDIDHDSGELIQDAACAECVNLRGLLLNLEQDNRRLEKDLRAWRAKYERLTEDRDAKLRNDKHYPAALDLIDEWKRECGHPNASASDPKRVQLALSVVKRYKDEREKLSLVIQQAKHLAYRDPNTGYRFDSFGKIFGSSDEIEKRATIYYLWRRRQGGTA